MVFGELFTKLNKIIGLDIFKAVSGTSLLKVISLLASLVITLLLTNNLTATEFGKYTFILSLIMIIGLPSTGGVSRLVVREISKLNRNESLRKLSLFWNWVYRLVTILSMISCLATIAWITIQGRFSNAPIQWEFIIAAPAIVFSAVLAVKEKYIQGLGRSVVSQLGTLLFKPIIFILLLTIATIYVDLNINIVLVCYLLALFLATTFFFIAFKNFFPESNPGALDSIHKKEYWASIFRLSIISGGTLLLSNVDILMLSGLMGFEPVAYYKVALQFSGLVIFGLVGVNQYIQPRFAAAFHEKNELAIRQLIKSAWLISIILGLIISMLILLFSTFYFDRLFPLDYQATLTPLKILMAGQLCSLFFGSCGVLLNMSSNEKYSLISILISLMINIILNSILIPQYGIVGAAISTSLSILALNYLMWHFCLRNLKINSIFLFSRPEK